MKKKMILIAISISIFSCKNETLKGKFDISGEIKNTPDQKIFLEQVYFSQKSPEVLDTAEIKNGKFTLSATAGEEGLYRLRMEKSGNGFIFINDRPNIAFKADLNDSNLEGHSFNTPANTILKNFIVALDVKARVLNAFSEKMSSLKGNDSALAMETVKREELSNNYKNFILHFIDTASDPVVVMLALGNTQGIEPAALSKTVSGLTRRFPNHKGIESIVSQYNEYISRLKEPKPAKTSMPGPGALAPDFTMNDTGGNPFSLSQLKGKYVLVDFWASWCGPCRGENPNVVAAYNKYKNKNFTVLGVSLDENRSAWLKAIKDDKLDWKQVSDLKQWNSAVVALYGFEGIPYNVLVDPTGKIIAAELRGEGLDQKLAEILK